MFIGVIIMLCTQNTISKIDQHVANKIHALRVSQGISSQKLSKEIGVSRQQLKKYEAAISRVSASRLLLISKALSKNISYFYQDISFIIWKKLR